MRHPARIHVLYLQTNQLVCVVLCAYRKRTIMSEYGPILDSNNPLSLDGDNPDQGIAMHETSEIVCLLSVICLLGH